MVRRCETRSCFQDTKTIKSTSNYNILKLEFGTETYMAADLISFLTKYAKIVYIDSDNGKQEIDIQNAINEKYYGKEAFLKVPTEVDENTKISLDLTIRNKKYSYQLN